jgi:ribosomal protein S18 acetylase RimI-like enzyme
MDITIEELKATTNQINDRLLVIVKQLRSDIRHESFGLWVQRILDFENEYLLVAKSGERICGVLTLIAYPLLEGNFRAWIDDVVVDEALRGQGIGEQLMEGAIELAKQKGFTEINLTSNPKREAANHLYRKIGFQKHETNCFRLLLK